LEEASINSKMINKGDYSSMKWNQYAMELHMQDLLSHIEGYITQSNASFSTPKEERRKNKAMQL